MLQDGTPRRLHSGKAPGSYLHRSHPDVARTEHLTFIASREAWAHGVFVGASMGSETTAAVGKCGHNL